MTVVHRIILKTTQFACNSPLASLFIGGTFGGIFEVLGDSLTILTLQQPVTHLLQPSDELQAFLKDYFKKLRLGHTQGVLYPMVRWWLEPQHHWTSILCLIPHGVLFAKRPPGASSHQIPSLHFVDFTR